MITGLWKHTRLICNNHAQCCPEMIVEDNGRQTYYMCPRYYEENRAPLERPCMNRVSIDDYERVLELLSGAIIEAEDNGEKLYLDHYALNLHGAKYSITSSGDSDFVISVTTSKAVQHR